MQDAIKLERTSVMGLTVLLVIVLATAGLLTACGGGAASGALIGAVAGAVIGSSFDDCYDCYDDCYDCGYYKPGDSGGVYDETW